MVLTEDSRVTQARNLRLNYGITGIAPFPINNGEKFPWQKCWQIKARQNPPHACTNINLYQLGTGILADYTPTVDFDINDPVLLQEADRIVIAECGDSPLRYRTNSPRILRPYRAADGWDVRKASCKNKATDDALEILGRGNQFFAYGRHPSGVDLFWRDGPDQTSYQQLNTMSEAQRDRIIEAVADLIGADRISNRPSDMPLPVCKLSGDEWPIGDIIAALDAIPNIGTDWEWWRNIAAAVWDASCSSQEGFMAFVAWSCQCRPRSGSADKLWRGLCARPLYEITSGTLVWNARQNDPDWDRPSRYGFTGLTFNKDH